MKVLISLDLSVGSLFRCFTASLSTTGSAEKLAVSNLANKWKPGSDGTIPKMLISPLLPLPQRRRKPGGCFQTTGLVWNVRCRWPKECRNHE